MQMRYSSDRGRRRHGAVQVWVDGEDVVGWEMVLPVDDDRPVLLRIEGRAGIMSFISP